jgi:hypothetical protein
MLAQPCAAIARYSNHYSKGHSGVVKAFYLPLLTPAGESARIICMTIRDEEISYATPIERTISGTAIRDLEWIDIGFGTPAQNG